MPGRWHSCHYEKAIKSKADVAWSLRKREPRAEAKHVTSCGRETRDLTSVCTRKHVTSGRAQQGLEGPAAGELRKGGEVKAGDPGRQGGQAE